MIQTFQPTPPNWSLHFSMWLLPGIGRPTATKFFTPSLSLSSLPAGRTGVLSFAVPGKPPPMSNLHFKVQATFSAGSSQARKSCNFFGALKEWLVGRILDIQSSDSPILIQSWSNPRTAMLVGKHPKDWISVQESAKRRSPGLVNFVPGVAYHFCLALPAAFTQPADQSYNSFG